MAQIWHNEQINTGPGALWTGWNFLSQEGDQARVLALAAHDDGRMHAVMAGLDNQIWHNEQTGPGAGPRTPWTGWNFLSEQGNQATALALASHDGRMHAVMAGLDNQIWHNEQTDVEPGALWTGWNFLSKQGDEAIVLALAGHPESPVLRMHAVMTGLDNQIWHNEQINADLGAPWTGWNFLSRQGNRAKALALAVHPDDRMHALMIGLDNQIWHNEQTDTGLDAPWTGWNFLSNRGDQAIALALARHPEGRMHAVMAGLDNQIWHNEQTDTGPGAPWTGWNFLSEQGNRATALTLASHNDGRMHAVMVGLDNQIWHNEQTGNGPRAPWTGWNFLSNPGDLGVAVALAVHPDDCMHALMIGL